MPNKKGGKGYKKGKGNDETMMQFVDIMPGQYMARAIRILGDRNILCYCDDNVLRICHIRRTMKGRVWIEIGDMVLVSLRDFNTDDPKTIKRGDILAKYPPEQVRVLKREGGVNERLFMKLEDKNGITIEAVGEDKTLDIGILDKKQDDGFDFESGSESESEDESESEETKIVSKRDKVKQRGERQERDVAAIESAGAEKDVSLDDL
jgi:translation initiation factor 1A